MGVTLWWTVYLIAFAFATYNILFWYSEVIEIERTGRARSDAEFLFLLRNLDTHVLRGKEACDSFVPFTGVHLHIETGITMQNSWRQRPTLAKIRKTSASYELVIHILDPLIIHWFPSFFARVLSANASEPEEVSDRQKDPSW